MEIKNCSVYNFENAFRGMRNPLNSWKMSDSYFNTIPLDDDFMQKVNTYAKLWATTTPEDSYVGTVEDLIDDWKVWVMKNGIVKAYCDETIGDIVFIGPKDMNLARRLCDSGSEHRKFLREIMVSIDITAPLYW